MAASDSSPNPEKRGLNVWIPFLLSLMVVIGMMIGMRLQTDTARTIQIIEPPISKRTETGRVEEVIRFIESKYVDDVDRDKLIDEAIVKLLDDLDPHSNFISSDQLRDVNEQLEGNFEGIGVEFMFIEDTIVVVTPLSGGPAESVGVMAGDKIVMIEDSIVAGVDLGIKGVVNLLRGEKGSDVNIGVTRGDNPDIQRITITRDEIPLHSVEVGYMLNNNTGYIRINRFSSTTYEEFMEHLGRMVNEEGLEHLVLDLRQNPGGYLKEATDLLSQLFEEKDQLLVYTEGRTVHRNDYKSTGRPVFDIDKVAVLIDEGSASASEIVAGAIQDWDRGVIIGRRSFGKGLVQEQYNLKKDAALRLTVARYYTPSGRSIQKAYTDRESYSADVASRFETGELLSADSIENSDTTRYFTSGNREVYGGGGITPDIFIPIDTTLFDDSYIQLRQHVPEFVYRMTQKMGESLDTYKEARLFAQTFKVSDSQLNEFLAFTQSKGVEAIPIAEWQKIREDIRLSIKARLARQIFQNEGFYQVWNRKDPAVQKALSALRLSNPLMAVGK